MPTRIGKGKEKMIMVALATPDNTFSYRNIAKTFGVGLGTVANIKEKYKKEIEEMQNAKKPNPDEVADQFAIKLLEHLKKDISKTTNVTDSAMDLSAQILKAAESGNAEVTLNEISTLITALAKNKGIDIDKIQLLSGNPTSRSESTSTNKHDINGKVGVDIKLEELIK